MMVLLSHPADRMGGQHESQMENGTSILPSLGKSSNRATSLRVVLLDKTHGLFL